MSTSNVWRPNNSAAILFLIVQVIAFALFFLDADIVAYTGSSLPLPPTAEYISAPIVCLMIAFVAFTFAFLRRFPTPQPQTFEINFPYFLHGVILVLELLYTIYLRGDAVSIEEVRDKIASGESSLGALKISTAVLYMTTLLLFANLASLKGSARVGEKMKLWCVAFVTVALFLLKDSAVGSRGSLLNTLCFALAGWTFVRPITVRSLCDLRFMAGTAAGSTLLAALFYQLTVTRAGGMDLAVLHDTILIKFSSNLTVVHEYLIGTLHASIRFFWSSEWTPASEIPFFQFFPTLSGLVNKYIFFDFGYIEGSVYYNVYEGYPFNSTSYMLRLFVLGPVLAVPAMWLIIRVYFLIGRTGPHMAFFAHCLLVYFAVQSFSGLPLTEIPFVLVPILALLFRRTFVQVSRFTQRPQSAQMFATVT